MKTPFLLFGLIGLLTLLSASPSCASDVKLGIDVLEEASFSILENKKVGLVAHPASVNSQMLSTVDVLRNTSHCKLVALFGPEHGVYADEYAGVKISDRSDTRTGIAIYSLYGKNRKPTHEMLMGLDVLVFDLQDIGSRSYTYISTMKTCLEACAEEGIEFVVLDRPNPLGGERIEGPMVEKGYESFVSALPVPYLHGMTMGELANLMKEQVAPHYQKLRVVPMSGWKRSMTWVDTGLNWVPTSPHIPETESCAAYAATGIMGELSQFSIGVGYTQPFRLIGGPLVQGDALAQALSLYWQNPRAYYKATLAKETLPTDLQITPCPEGMRFRSTRFKPFYGGFKDLSCQGVHLYVDPHQSKNLMEINFRALATLDAARIFRTAKVEEISMFDKVCGSDQPRKWLMEERQLDALFEQWNAQCQRFRATREKFLLYPSSIPQPLPAPVLPAKQPTPALPNATPGTLPPPTSSSSPQVPATVPAPPPSTATQPPADKPAQ